jgi:hypothetical protein
MKCLEKQCVNAATDVTPVHWSCSWTVTFIISPVSESAYVAGKLNSCITVCQNIKRMLTLFGPKTLKVKVGHRKHMHCLLESRKCDFPLTCLTTHHWVAVWMEK